MYGICTIQLVEIFMVFMQVNMPSPMDPMDPGIPIKPSAGEGHLGKTGGKLQLVEPLEGDI